MTLIALLLAQLASISGQASVIDGDTLEIQGQRIRIHGIDAPESRQECQRGGRAWRCGQQSALELSKHINQGVVICNPASNDRYGRVVARCTVRGEDIAHWSVSQGWALDWPQYSRGEYQGAESEAKAAGRGVWQGEFTAPWLWRAQQKAPR